MKTKILPPDQMDAAELGAWLGRWRRFCGHSFKTCERYTGIDGTRLSRAEAGELMLSPSERFVLIDFLGVEIRKILESTDGRVFVPEPLAEEPLLGDGDEKK